MKIGTKVTYYKVVKKDGTKTNPVKTETTSEPWTLGHGEMPTPCVVCNDVFDLHDGYEGMSEKTVNITICPRCYSIQEEDVQRLEIIDVHFEELIIGYEELESAITNLNDNIEKINSLNISIDEVNTLNENYNQLTSNDINLVKRILDKYKVDAKISKLLNHIQEL